MEQDRHPDGIRLLALDIDGVLTDGRVWLDEAGQETKVLNYRDIDAVFRAQRQGLAVALVTGEDTPWVDMIARRLEVARVYKGAKDKERALRALGQDAGVPLAGIAYVGDSERDAPALRIVGLGLVPRDADPAAQAAAAVVLSRAGGQGAVDEAVQWIQGHGPDLRPL